MQSVESFFLIIGALIGSIFLIVFGRQFLMKMSSDNWEKVPGHVHQAVVEEYEGEGRTHRFQVRVDYRYVYNSISRNGRHFESLSFHTSFSEAQELSNGYVPGQLIDVYVYKKSPQKVHLCCGFNY